MDEEGLEAEEGRRELEGGKGLLRPIVRIFSLSIRRRFSPGSNHNNAECRLARAGRSFEGLKARLPAAEARVEEQEAELIAGAKDRIADAAEGLPGLVQHFDVSLFLVRVWAWQCLSLLSLWRVAEDRAGEQSCVGDV